MTLCEPTPLKLYDRMCSYLHDYRFTVRGSLGPQKYFNPASYFLAHLAKGHMNFCHHLPSIVCGKLSYLHLLLKTLNQVKLNLAEMILVWSPFTIVTLCEGNSSETI